jgi:hypothetical protein
MKLPLPNPSRNSDNIVGMSERNVLFAQLAAGLMLNP